MDGISHEPVTFVIFFSFPAAAAAAVHSTHTHFFTNTLIIFVGTPFSLLRQLFQSCLQTTIVFRNETIIFIVVACMSVASSLLMTDMTCHDLWYTVYRHHSNPQNMMICHVMMAQCFNENIHIKPCTFHFQANVNLLTIEVWYKFGKLVSNLTWIVNSNYYNLIDGLVRLILAGWHD